MGIGPDSEMQAVISLPASTTKAMRDVSEDVVVEDGWESN